MKQILCIKLVKYWDKYTEMHGQQNVKNPDINFHESVNWEPNCFMRTDGRTERNDEANSQFHLPQFRSRTVTLTLRIDTKPWRRIRGVEIKLHTLFFSQLPIPPRHILPLARRLLKPSVDLDILTKRNFPASVHNRTPVLYSFDGNSLIGY